jgi:hypothetical protein
MGEHRAVTHALRVTDAIDAFRSLFTAIAERGERAGWLELDATPSVSPGENDGAEVWKRVVVEERRTVAVKTRRGPPVLRDLLREHFRGCQVVLVRGDVPLPALRPNGPDWELRPLDDTVRRLTTDELVRALRSPRFGV